MNVAIVVGNPKPRSRTWQAAQLVAEKIAGRPADLSVDLVDCVSGARTMAHRAAFAQRSGIGQEVGRFRLRGVATAAGTGYCLVWIDPALRIDYRILADGQGLFAAGGMADGAVARVAR